ncbi:hypothetical protein [Pajaroellobacter abortibovis]|uniref:Outer membrane protein beta-barrel domain-containing protein n=1 Tax=Pajaroellobacter abortibovis TaxID=1882918 RepID=A0A1L6MVN5_9BACT|nr:hypothetical protein [Pajaroellobacter abortibovis]APR99571.1 hypothetical protein BCY86_01905 [Pajaroellobacter abortibovis]
MSSTRRFSAVIATITAGGSLGGCAGGTPLLHPARVLPPQQVRAFTGFSSQWITGPTLDNLRTAHQFLVNRPPSTPEADPTYAKSVLLMATLAPGLAPVAGARTGLGKSLEVGLTYTGRTARADIRRSFKDTKRHLALSIGIGGAVPFHGPEQVFSIPSITLSDLWGYGFDVPLLLGWESSLGMYKAWLGTRSGYEHIGVKVLDYENPSPSFAQFSATFSASRLWSGLVFGLEAGFRDMHIGFELGLTHHIINGNYLSYKETLYEWTLTPASAVSWQF